jgi:hypothetical protein
VYDDTKPFVYNYGKHVVLPMVMEHAVNKLFIKKKELPTGHRCLMQQSLQ